MRGMNGEVLAVYENDVIKMHNIYEGGEMIGNYDRSQRRYFLKDHLGSVRTTVDQNGAVDGYTDYYPFGLTMPGRSYTNQGTALNANKYTGHERDEEANLTLDYMLARNYDPQIGRFLQIDPLASQFPGWNPYHYVHNNPIRLIDPTGMAACDPPDDCSWADRIASWFSKPESQRQEDFGGQQQRAVMQNHEGIQEGAEIVQEAAQEGIKNGLAATKQGADNVSIAAAITEGTAAGITVISGGTSSPVTGPVIVGAHATGLAADLVGTAASGMEVLLSFSEGLQVYH